MHDESKAHPHTTFKNEGKLGHYGTLSEHRLVTRQASGTKYKEMRIWFDNLFLENIKRRTASNRGGKSE